LHEIFREGLEWPWDDLITFWVNLGKRLNFLLSLAIAQPSVNKSVSFARWQQGAGFVVPRPTACLTWRCGCLHCRNNSLKYLILPRPWPSLHDLENLISSLNLHVKYTYIILSKSLDPLRTYGVPKFCTSDVLICLTTGEKAASKLIGFTWHTAVWINNKQQGAFITGVLSTVSAAARDWNEGMQSFNFRSSENTEIPLDEKSTTYNHPPSHLLN